MIETGLGIGITFSSFLVFDAIFLYSYLGHLEEKKEPPERILKKQDPRLAVLITARNEEEDTLRRTFSSLLESGYSKEQIFFANDGFELDDSKTFKSAQKIFLKENIFKFPAYGKPRAMLVAAMKINELEKFEFINMCDADLVYGKNSPTINLDFFEGPKVAGIAYNIIPVVEKKYRNNKFSRRIVSWQRLEYAIAIMLSKAKLGKHGNVQCASGAFTVWKLEDYIKIMLENDQDFIFTGDDQRTAQMCQLLSKKIVYDQQITIYTEAPSTIRELWRQRTHRWWPGLWKNMDLSFKILRSKKQKTQLKVEVFRDVLSALLDIPKVFSLLFLLFLGDWELLTTIYILYMATNLYIDSELEKRREDHYIEDSFFLYISYPFYQIFNSVTRVRAMFRAFVKKLTHEWRLEKKRFDINLITSFLLLIPFLGQAQEQKKESNTKIDINTSFVNNSNLGDALQLHGRIDVKNFYLEAKTAYEYRISSGYYIKIKHKKSSSVIKPSAGIRYKGLGYSMGLRYTNWNQSKFAPFFDYKFFSGGRENNNEEGNANIAQLGSFYQVHDYHLLRFFVNQRIEKDFNDQRSFHVAQKYSIGKWTLDHELYLGTKSTRGYLLRIFYKKFYLKFNTQNKIDFSRNNQSLFGVGFKTKL